MSEVEVTKSRNDKWLAFGLIGLVWIALGVWSTFSNVYLGVALILLGVAWISFSIYRLSRSRSSQS